MSVEIRRLGPDDADIVLAAGNVFDHAPRRDWTERFLAADDHHLLVALAPLDAGTAGPTSPTGPNDTVVAGFVSGVETTHPDKGTEMFLYELGVDERYQRRGIGRALVEALRRLAEERGCYGMWVSTEPDNHAAIATYRAAGLGPPGPDVTLVAEWTPREDR